MSDDATSARDGPPKSTEEEEEAVRRAREEVVEAMERTADIYGLKRSYGRLYGILFFADEPLSLDDLVEESSYAKSTVSTAMNGLHDFYLVHRRSVPGEGKKAYYEAERDFWYVVKRLLDDQMRREVTVMTRALDDAAERLEEADGGEMELERIQDFRQSYHRVERVLDFLTGQSLGRLTDVLDRFTSSNDDSPNRR